MASPQSPSQHLQRSAGVAAEEHPAGVTHGHTLRNRRERVGGEESSRGERFIDGAEPVALGLGIRQRE